MIKLLHVEDDADIREIAKMSLELSGDFVVEQCDCGEQALEKTLDYIPDVFLLDMMMPGMTGRQTLEKLRENPDFANVPAIFMTARAQPKRPAGRLHSPDGKHPVSYRIVLFQVAVLVVFATFGMRLWHLQAHVQDVVGIVAGVDGREARETRHQQPGAHQ